MVWRADKPVLASDNLALGSLAVICSLGKAGYPGIAISEHVDAIGFVSQYAKSALVCPGYNILEYFNQWLYKIVKKYDIKVMIPSEGMLLAIRPYFGVYIHIKYFPITHSRQLLSAVALIRANITGYP